jgi:hypothetical protein
MLLDAAAELDVDLRASWMIGDTDGDVGPELPPAGPNPDRGARQRA